MATAKISIISPAFRPENWLELHKNVSDTRVDFEFVYVGPNSPDYSLPDNFKFIKSNVKPAQCAEIAARNATGDLIMWVSDDSLFKTERPLDKLYETYINCHNEKAVVSANYDHPSGWNRYNYGDIDSPLLALHGLMSTKYWDELGGVDRRFIAVFWTEDISMRVHASGGEIVLSDVYMDEQVEGPLKPRSRGSQVMKDHLATDKVLLDQLWVSDGKAQLERSTPLERFDDTEILVRSQEPQGRWKYQSNLINKLMTSSAFYMYRNMRASIEGRARRFKIRNIPRYITRLKGGR